MGQRAIRFGVASFLLALGIAPRIAAAQDVGSAETMFQKGVSDMEANRLDAACPEIAESLRLDPRAGTLFTLAECYAKAGRTASAVARYQDYLDQYTRMTPDQQSKQSDRPQVSQRQIATLTPGMPLLTLRLPAGAPAGTEVKRDGIVLSGPSLGTPLHVDPGQHVVTAQPPGGGVASQTIVMRPAERKDVVLGLTANGGLFAADDRGTPQRIAGFAIAGAGVAGLIVGAITGGLTLSAKSSAEATCNFTTHKCTDDRGLADVSRAKTTGVASTIAFAAGGVLAGAGIIVIVTAPHGSRGAVRVGVRPGYESGVVSVSGAF